MRTFLLGTSVPALLLALSTASASAAIVKNGGFETGDFSDWTVSNIAGSTPPGPPQVIKTGVANATGYQDFVPNYEGTHAAFFVSDQANQSISQSVTLAANKTYALTFGLFATQSGANNPNFFTLTDSLGGNVLNSYTNSSSTTDVPVGTWTPESDLFTTTAAGSFLLTYNFTAGAQPAKDVLLDAVSISLVPLPASAPMFGAALAALGLVGCTLKRRKAAAAA